MRREQSARVSVPVFEGLESRLLLAGGVSAYVSAGSLYVIGDWFDNDIVVTGVSDSEIRVASGSDATLINNEAGPLTFTDITADVILAMGDGNDTLEVTNVNVPRDLRVDTGPGGDNEVLIQSQAPGNLGDLSATTIGRDALIIGTYGEDDIEIDGVEFLGNLTIDGGASADQNNISLFDSSVDGSLIVYLWSATGFNSVEVDNSSIGDNAEIYHGTGALELDVTDALVGGNVFVRNFGGGVLLTGGELGIALAGSERIANSEIGGDLTILNGAGNDEVRVRTSDIGGSVFIDNATGAATVQVRRSDIGGSLTVAGAGAEAGPVFATGYNTETHIVDTAVGGSLAILQGSGADNVKFKDTDDEANGFDDLGPAGSGPSVAGDVLIIGGADRLRVKGPISARNATILSGAGDDTVAIVPTLTGYLYIDCGPGGADFGLGDGSAVGGNVIFLRGSGGESTIDSSLASLIGITGSDIGGNLFVVNGSGDDELQFDETAPGLGRRATSVGGDVIVLNGAGSTRFFGMFSSRNVLIVSGTGDDWVAPVPMLTGWFYADLGPGGATCGFDPGSDIAGNVTVLRGSGGESPNRAGFAFWGGIDRGDLGGNYTYLGGAGNDDVEFTLTPIGGSVFIGTGADAALVRIDGSSNIGGSVTVLRGDGGALAAADASKSGFASTAASGAPLSLGPDPTAGILDISETMVTGGVTYIAGSGDDEVGFPTSSIQGDVYVNTGLGRASLTTHFGELLGNVTFWAFDDDVTVDAEGNGETVIGGTVFIQTGRGDDAFDILGIHFTGDVTFCSFYGDDTLAIDDTTVDGDLFIRTGPEVASGAFTDDDILNVEGIADSGGFSEFFGTFTVRAGAGDDLAAGGSGGESDGATFHGQADFDGGPGDDTVEDLGGIWTFDVTPIITNVETVIV